MACVHGLTVFVKRLLAWLLWCVVLLWWEELTETLVCELVWFRLVAPHCNNSSSTFHRSVVLKGRMIMLFISNYVF